MTKKKRGNPNMIQEKHKEALWESAARDSPSWNQKKMNRLSPNNERTKRRNMGIKQHCLEHWGGQGYNDDHVLERIKWQVRMVSPSRSKTEEMKFPEDPKTP